MPAEHVFADFSPQNFESHKIRTKYQNFPIFCISSSFIPTKIGQVKIWEIFLYFMSFRPGYNSQVENWEIKEIN